MSQYISFYIKSNKKYLPLASYSRSTSIYEYAYAYVTYGDGKAITQDLIKDILNDINKAEINFNKQLKEMTDRIQLITQMNNNVDDKLEAIFNCEAEIKELNECKEDLITARCFYTFINDILTEVKYDESIKEKNSYVWFGIEWCPNYKD